MMLLDHLRGIFVEGLRGTADAPDPVTLADQCDLKLDPWQQGLVLSSEPWLMLCSRQAGKSTTAALLALHTAATEPGSLSLIVAPAQRQAAESFLKVKSLLAALGPRAPALRRESALALTMTTGSRIVVIPGEERTVRGFSSVRLLVLDEAARIPDELYMALRPMMAVSQGRIIALSTPWGMRGWFYHEWQDGGPAWHRTRITADQCPRIDTAWLAAERERIGEWWYRQEYMCEFVTTTDSLFTEPQLRAAFSDDIEPLFSEEAAA
jgi:hypothetical protein